MTLINDNPGFAVSHGTGALELIDFPTEVINPSNDCWFMDATKVTKDGAGLVSALASTKTGGRTLTQASAASQPLWVDAQLGGRPALRFASQVVGAPDRLPLTNFPAGVGLSWTKRLVIKALAPSANGFPTGTIWNGEGGTAGHRVELAWSVNDGDHVLCRAGPSLSLSVKAINWPINTWFLLENSYDHVLGKLALSINGAPWVLSSVSGVAVDSTTAYLGAISTAGSNTGFNGDIAYAGIIPLALHLSANAAVWADNKALIRHRFAADTVFAAGVL